MERTPEAYTKAILAAILEPWIDGLAQVARLYQTDAKLSAQLDDGSVEPAAKMALLARVLPENTPPELHNFLNVLLTQNDFGLVDDVLVSLSRVVTSEAGGPQRAIITSAVVLSETDQVRIRTHLIERFGANLEFSFQVDPELLGGLVVRVGDKLIDDSVRGRIVALRNSLGVHTA
ncbi:MAG: ATP synthase F1 subunit delta [Chloroflexi bacterium]|nr:ATP synthase F1 subunit delta [Chloroflexota bacterium]